MMTTERIAKIRSTRLGYEDHGILTAYLDLDYGGGGQGAGGYELDRYDEGEERRLSDAACGTFITGVLRACGVNTWEAVAGRTVIAIVDDEPGGLVRGIKSLPTEPGGTFMFRELVKADQ